MSKLMFDLDPKQLGEDIEKGILLEKHSIEELLWKLGTSSTHGLTSNPDVLNIHKKHFGENVIKRKLHHGIFYHIRNTFKNSMLAFFFICGILLLIAEIIREKMISDFDWLSIILEVLLIVAVISLNEYFKDKKLQYLVKSILSGNKCTVIRDGNIFEINTADLVVGDIYLPKRGEQIPADGILLKSGGLKIKGMGVTGEWELVTKHPVNSPYILAFTYVHDGSGMVLILAVGINSQKGRIKKLILAYKNRKESVQRSQEKITTKKDKSVLKEKLTNLAKKVGYIRVSVGVLLFAIQAIKYSINNFTGDNARKLEDDDIFEYLLLLMQLSFVIDTLVNGCSPFDATIPLLNPLIRMFDDKNLENDLYSCETMGSVTTICTNKTGSLTTNIMTVIQAHLYETRFNSDENLPIFSKKHLETMIMNICFNKCPTSALKDADTRGATPVQLGNKTDCALLGFLTKLNTSYKAYTGKYIAKYENIHNISDVVIKLFPFNSIKRMMSVIIDLFDGNARILVKGAPDILLTKCVYQFSNENIVKIDYKMRKTLKKSDYEMSVEGLRTIVLAYKDVSKTEITEGINEKELIKDLVFIALLGIEDPVRPDVPEAIRSLQKAGITVRMVTSDSINTARSIALKCGILGSETDELILDSVEFKKLIYRDEKFDQDSFDKVLPKLRVLARSSPNLKYDLVTGIRGTRLDQQVVAVTGGKIKDINALRAADVGFVMESTGTDIAKIASDIIIPYDNFSNIVSEILKGRNLYDCISKFLIFHLTVNLVAATSFIIFSIFWYNIFYSLQLLWINLVMNSFASLALTTDGPTRDLINRKPYARNKSLFSRFMIMFILLHSLYQIGILMLLTICGSSWFSIEDNFALNFFREANRLKRVDTKHSTIIFNIFVLMQIFNKINSRRVRGERNVFQNICNNMLFVVIFFLELALQCVIVQFGGKLFHVVALSVEQWLWCVFFASSVLFFHQVMVVIFAKVLPILKKRSTATVIASSLVISEEPTTFNAQLLWIRCLKKFQTKHSFIDTFKENLNATATTIRMENPEILLSSRTKQNSMIK